MRPRWSTTCLPTQRPAPGEAVPGLCPHPSNLQMGPSWAPIQSWPRPGSAVAVMTRARQAVALCGPTGPGLCPPLMPQCRTSLSHMALGLPPGPTPPTWTPGKVSLPGKSQEKRQFKHWLMFLFLALADQRSVSASAQPVLCHCPRFLAPQKHVVGGV